MVRTPTPGPSPWRAVGLAAAAGGLITLVSLLPLDSVAYHSSTLHVAIETAATFIALLCVVLLFGRYLREPTASDLVIAGGLLLLCLTNLFYSVIPWIVDEQPGSFHTWAPVAGRLIGAGALAVGGWIETGQIRDPQRAATQMFAAVGGTLVLIGLLGAALSPHLPVGIDPDVPPNQSGPELVGSTGLLVCQVISALLYTFAAFGFASRAERTRDELLTWLATATIVAAFARLNYFIFPSINSEWVYTGDILRLLSYALILVGAIREIGRYQTRLAEAAVYGERRRIARELHDGLAQELAFIRSQAHRLRPGAEEPATQIALAAERALDESRQAIATLARPVDASLDSSVAQAAEEMTLREDVELRLQLQPALEAPDPVHEALTRIVREALGNAIRHGRARSVVVTLVRDEGLRLTIDDDGTGIPADAEDRGGFGLVSMRERAEALGGSMHVNSAGDRGARVEVWLP